MKRTNQKSKKENDDKLSGTGSIVRNSAGNIVVKNPRVYSRYTTNINPNINKSPALEDFDWNEYEDGWNGVSLKRNKKIKSVETGDIIYSHATYADALYKQMNNIKVDNSKELVANSLVKITDIVKLDNDTVMLSINNGANNVIVDLNKEQKFFNQFTINDTGDIMTKETFVQAINIPEFKNNLLGMDLSAKILPGNTEKASIWDGYVETLTNELKEQVTKNSKAYFATILSTNKGGFVVDIMNTVKAFMPGSMSSANRVTDFESMVGTRFEVMVESYDPKFGFVVSRKKFIRAMIPSKIAELKKKVEENKDTVFTGHVTGTTPFGVFVELDDFITGMLHKTLVRDETREAMRENAIEPGTEVNCYIHKIEGTRVILSDVPSDERDAVIARREAEELEAENKEKNAE